MKSNWEEFYKVDVPINEYLENLCHHSLLFKEIINENPIKILEVGIGTGSMSIFLSHLGFDVTGIDYNEKIVKKSILLNKKLNGNAKFVQCNAFDLKRLNNDFDVVFSQGFFEHFSNEEIKTLISEQIKIGKTIIFSVPSKFYPQKDLGNERLLSKSEWSTILKDYNIVYNKYYAYHFLPPKNWILNFFKFPNNHKSIYSMIKKPVQILIKINRGF